MRKSVLVTLAVTLAVCLAPSSVLGSDETAEELLRRVGETYASLERFHFEATETTVTRSGDLERRTESRVVTAADESGRFRVASDHPTEGGIVAFDGRTTWVYLARRHQYQEIKGAMLEDPDAPGLMRLKNRFASRYADITKRLRSATFVAMEPMDVNGRRSESRVVQATYDAPRGLAAEQIVRRYWISNDARLVHRESSAFEARNPASGRTTRVAQEIVFHRVEVNEEVSEGTFSPELPEGAEPVAAFDEGGAGLVGRPAANFELSDLSGMVRRSSDLEGKVVLFNFWASWCVPCRIDLPRVEALHRELSGKGLVVLGVNDEPADRARAFVEEHRFTFPTLADSEGTLFRAYEVRTIPTAVIIGRDGKVASVLVGSHSSEELRAAVREAGIE